MKRVTWALVAIGMLAVLTIFGQPLASAGDAACGAKGQPSCPLQGWMEKNMDAAVEKADAKALAAAFEKAASLVPDPKWNEGDSGWAKIANSGASAAAKGDISAAKKECKSCHKAWRDKYKLTYRTKPVSAQ
jgi:hypothetical protein